MFNARDVEVDGLRIRYMEAGAGTPLVHVPGAGGVRLTPAHDLLARRFRVIALETPGADQPDVAATMGRAIEHLGIDRFNLIGTADGGAVALRLAIQEPERVLGLVLEAPTAILSEWRDTELERQLAGLATPTLVLFGTRDRVSAQETGRIYAERIPNGHLVFVYDAADAIGHDRPEAFAEVVVDFLERHEAFIISRTPTVIHP